MKNILIALSLFLPLLPSVLHPQELHSIGMGGAHLDPEIIVGKYLEGIWIESVFPPARRFQRNFDPALAVSPAGELWAAWAAFGDGDQPKIYFSRKRGDTWSQPLRVTDAGGEDNWEMTPALAFGPDGALRAAWAGARDGSFGIYLARWEGTGFGAATMVSSAGSSPVLHPALSAASSGRILLVWQGWDGAYYRVFSSRFDGREWSPAQAITAPVKIDQVRPAVVSLQGDRWECFWAEDGRLVSAVAEIWGWTRPVAADAFFEKTRGLTGEPPGYGWVVERDNSGNTRTRRTGILFDSARVTPFRGEKSASNLREYIGYGDSITAGWDGSGGYPPYYSYIPNLQTMLNNAYGGGYTVHNRGYGGATTTDLLSGGGRYNCPGLDQVLDWHPTASRILIMGGTNDAFYPAYIKNNLEAMIDRARSRGYEPVLATIIPANRSAGAYNDQKNLNTNYIIPLAGEKNCLLADPWQAYHDYGDWTKLLISYDNLHPNQAGAQIIANAFFAGLPTPSPIPSPTPVQLLALTDSGDYNGNGRADIAVFRPSSGLWAVRGVTRAYFGTSSDLPVPGDYNNDGTTDIAVFRESSGLWAIRGLTKAYFGRAGDLPVPGDYSGDGFCEPAVFRKDTGLWASRGVTRAYFGAPEDIPVPGYYSDGRQKFFAVFRPASGLWAVRGLTRFYFGNSGDRPVPAGYEEDGSTDAAAVFRPASGLWAIRGISRFYYGEASDQPRPASYDGGAAIAAVFRKSSGLWGQRMLRWHYFGRAEDIPVSGRIPRPITPTPVPTVTPTPEPTSTPTTIPSATPTPEPTPTAFPTTEPTATPTSESTATPTPIPGATPSPTTTRSVTPSPNPTS